MDNLNKELLESECLEKLKKRFNDAPSFRHICIDNFLLPSFANELVEHFPSIYDMKSTTRALMKKNQKNQISPGFIAVFKN